MMKYAIFENEELARRNLIRTVSLLRPDYELDYEGESVEEAVEYFTSKRQPDFILMDIELVDGNCFDIFRKVDVDVPIIFTTAYRDFALEAFDVMAVDYLLKPITEQNLLRALVKLESFTIVPSETSQQSPVEPSRVASISQTPRKRLLVNIGDNYIWISLNDVAYFERDEKYVCVSLHSGRRYITDFQNLSNVISILDQEQFFQPSRNIVVSINAIRKVTKWLGGRLKVVIGNGTDDIEIIVSANRRPQFMAWMDGDIQQSGHFVD